MGFGQSAPESVPRVLGDQSGQQNVQELLYFDQKTNLSVSHTYENIKNTCDSHLVQNILT